jgi:DNA-binding response OmpR family regulator
MAQILVVDDNSDMRFLLKNLLLNNGYQIDIADNGLAALQKIEQGNYDLVLLDIRLPKLNGLSVLERVKENNHELKVIIITAYSNIANRTTALINGADGYLTKPFDNSFLLKKINEIING